MADSPVDSLEYFNPDGETWVEDIKDVCPKLREFQIVNEMRWDMDWALLMACEWGDFETVKDLINSGVRITETYKGCHLLIDFIPYPRILEYILERGAVYYINTVPNFQPYPRSFSPPDNLCALSKLILRRDSGRLILSRGSSEDKRRQFIDWKLETVEILLKFGASIENPESVIQPLDAAVNLVKDRETEWEGFQLIQLLVRFEAVADEHHITRASRIAATTRSRIASSATMVLAKTVGNKKPPTIKWRPHEVFPGAIRPQAYYPSQEGEQIF